MGRSLAPATQLIVDQITEVRPLYDALRRSDQLVLDEFFDSVAQHRAAIANAASLLPLEAILVVVQLEERKRLQRMLHELHAELQELHREVGALKGYGTARALGSTGERE